MTRDQYAKILPALLIISVIGAFVLAFVFPDLPDRFYLLFAMLSGVIIFIVALVFRSTVSEPLTDERIQQLTEKALRTAWKICIPFLMIGGFFLLFGFGSAVELKFLGMGTVLSVGLVSMVYLVVYQVERRRK